MSTRSRSPAVEARTATIVPPLWMNSSPVPFHLLQDEALAAEEPGAEPLRERDAEVDVADGAEKRVALAEHLLAVQRHVDDLARIRSGERDLRARPRSPLK